MAVDGGVRFDDGNLVLAAALAGQGVALTDDALAGEALADGRLVRLSEVAIATDKAYWLVHPPESAQRPKVAAFRAWLLAETRKPARALTLKGRCPI